MMAGRNDWPWRQASSRPTERASRGPAQSPIGSKQHGTQIAVSTSCPGLSHRKLDKALGQVRYPS